MSVFFSSVLFVLPLLPSWRCKVYRRARYTVSIAVKAVGRKPVLAAFVGRIHKDTTAEQLKVYLEAEGMKDDGAELRDWVFK